MAEIGKLSRGSERERERHKHLGGKTSQKWIMYQRTSDLSTLLFILLDFGLVIVS